MLRIPCPYCGIRDQAEFQFGGELPIKRPADPEKAGDAEWADYLFYRNNLRGLHLERWVHSYGCRQWIKLARDTETHEIRGAAGRGFSLPRFAANEVAGP